MKPAFKDFLFLRAYLGIVIGIVLVAVLLDLFLASRNRSIAEAETIQPYRPLFSLLTTNLLATEPGKREALLKEITASWSVAAQLIPLADFAGLEPLSDNEILLYYDNADRALLYQRLDSGNMLIALGPIPRINAGTYDTWIISAYYLLIAVILLLWIRPFSRDLTLLRQAATNFGKADFSTRLQLRENSTIEPVAQSFNAMAERIEYLVSAHRELTNAVSHELRTPLARFKFSLEILTRNDDPEKNQLYLDQMKQDVHELEELIDEMLTYAKLGERNLQLVQEELDLKVWLERELRLYKDAKIAVTCSFATHPHELGFIARANPELMARALHNIIRNSLRYASEQINIHLQCNGTICIRICDDGPGIPADHHQSIFEPFSRVELSRDRQSGGYGLGLAIAARIVERHQGSIAVHNCEPRGACFTIEWPRKRNS